MPIKSIGGNALNVSGWVLASQTTAPDTGITTSVYRGRLDPLAAAVTPLHSIKSTRSWKR